MGNASLRTVKACSVILQDKLGLLFISIAGGFFAHLSVWLELGDFVRVELCKETLRDVSGMKYIYARWSKYFAFKGKL